MPYFNKASRIRSSNRLSASETVQRSEDLLDVSIAARSSPCAPRGICQHRHCGHPFAKVFKNLIQSFGNFVKSWKFDSWGLDFCVFAVNTANAETRSDAFIMLVPLIHGYIKLYYTCLNHSNIFNKYSTKLMTCSKDCPHLGWEPWVLWHQGCFEGMSTWSSCIHM